MCTKLNKQSFEEKLSQLARLIFWLMAAWFIVACSAQPTDDAEDVLDQLPSQPDGGGDVSPTPTPTPTPLPSGADFSQTWTSQSDFNGFTLVNSEALASGELTIELDSVGETGQIDISDTLDSGIFVTVNFRNTYADPVIVAMVATNNETEPVEVRARNVTTSSAELFLQESSGGAHALETVTYIVMEKGRHIFANGTVIEANIHTTASYHNGISGSFGGDAVAFSSAFTSKPALLHMLNSNNNNEFMTTIGYNQNASGFTLQQDAAETGHVGVSEDIAWIAMSTGNDSLPEATYEVNFGQDGSNDGPDNNSPHQLSFSSFVTAPNVVVKQTSGNGNNGGWSRGEGTWDATNFFVQTEEDQENDSERSHIDEEYSWLAFSNNSDIGVYYSSAQVESPVVDISAVLRVDSTSVSWNEIVPAATSIVIESNLSLDGGSNWQGWQPVTQGGAVTGLSSGDDVSQGRVQLRITLSTADEVARPLLQDLTLSFTAD